MCCWIKEGFWNITHISMCTVVLPGGPFEPLWPLIPVPGDPLSPLSPGKPIQTRENNIKNKSNSPVDQIYFWFSTKIATQGWATVGNLSNYPFLLDFQVHRGFQGNLHVQFVQALHGFLVHQEGQEDQLALESWCDIQMEPGWASFQLWSSDLWEKSKSGWLLLKLLSEPP